MHGFCPHAHKDYGVSLQVGGLAGVANSESEGAGEVHASMGEWRGGRGPAKWEEAHAACKGSSIGPLAHNTGSGD